MRRPTQIKRKAAGVIQVTALLLLQLYPVLPVFGHFAYPVRHGAVCRMDHHLCGCSLERIANHTCCCFRSIEILRSMLKQQEMKSTPNPGTKRAPRFILPTCGDEPDFISAPLGKIKFLRFAAGPERPDFLLIIYRPVCGNTFRSRSSEPPDPPPKFITT
jgi:hypothetical protein